MKRHRTDADDRGKESEDDHARRRKSELPIYKIVPSPDNGRLVVTLRRERANTSSRMASPDSTISDTMGDVTNISHSRKERGSHSRRHHRQRKDGHPYGRNNEQSKPLDAEDEVKVPVRDESSPVLVVKGPCLPHKVALKRQRRLYLEQQQAMMQGLANDQDVKVEFFGEVAQRQDEPARNDLNVVQEGSSILQEVVEVKPESLDQVSISSTGCTSTNVEYDATIDDDED